MLFFRHRLPSWFVWDFWSKWDLNEDVSRWSISMKWAAWCSVKKINLFLWGYSRRTENTSLLWIRLLCSRRYIYWGILGKPNSSSREYRRRCKSAWTSLPALRFCSQQTHFQSLIAPPDVLILFTCFYYSEEVNHISTNKIYLWDVEPKMNRDFIWKL